MKKHVLIASLLAGLACEKQSAPSTTPTNPAPEPAADEPKAEVADAPRWSAPESNPSPGEGHDFIAEANILFRIVACGTRDAVPEPFDGTVVDAHCKKLLKVLQAYRDNFLSKAGPFFDNVRPKELPPTVVYPFGGGDLLTALTTYPEALEITTISLEYAGDPRRVKSVADPAVLEENLAMLYKTNGTLLRGNWNWTRNIRQLTKGKIPGQIVYALSAMVVHKHVPVSLRFFHINRDGTLDYMDDAEIEAQEGKLLPRMPYAPQSDWSTAFAHMEFRFQHKDGGPIKVYRHVAMNLSDGNITSDPDHLTKDPALLAHLAAKGEVAAMTRAGSHLLWEDGFSEIRNYLIKHAVWMPSDSTGVPPPFAKEAGLEQDVYGKFDGVYKAGDQDERNQYDTAFQDLFASQPARPLEFLYGYPDKNKQSHMVITHRPEFVGPKAR